MRLGTACRGMANQGTACHGKACKDKPFDGKACNRKSCNRKSCNGRALAKRRAASHNAGRPAGPGVTWERRNGGSVKLKSNVKEWGLVAMVGVIALLANLPADLTDRIGVRVDYLVIVLAAIVFVALLLYMRFTFFLIVILLVIGANLPGQYAERLNISRLPLLLALALMVGISLINHIVRILPSGLEKDSSMEAQKALFYAVEKGNLVYAQKLLHMNIDPNLKGPNGYTPLMFAAARGDGPLTELFLRNGANAALLNDEGDSAVDLALRLGHAPVAEILKQARLQQTSEGPKTSNSAFSNA